ncbi:hypothetical protein, partial [uncultured Mycolicibacterium sp.]|uniref:hypothetical protein n=1 Tax=uncultured Mycolicibacterium sp. TaxID=2320817 RepID=UPI0032B21ED3
MDVNPDATSAMATIYVTMKPDALGADRDAWSIIELYGTAPKQIDSTRTWLRVAPTTVHDGKANLVALPDHM